MTITMTSVPLALPAVPPFDFDASLRFVRAFPATTGEQDVTDGTLRLAVRAAGTTAAVRVRAGGGGLTGEIVAPGPVPDAARDEIADLLRFRFGLDDDLAPFYELARTDPPFAAVVERLYGYHQVKFGTPLELLCWAILSQRTPMPVVRRAKRALTDACGNEVDGLSAFPDLGQLLAFAEDELADLVRNARKARLLHGALRGWDGLDTAFLRHGPYDDVRAALLALPGVGPWSASFLLIRGLGRTERMEPDPEGLAAASRVYGRPVGAAEFRGLAERYGAWQGYWGHYLRVAG